VRRSERAALVITDQEQGGAPVTGPEDKRWIDGESLNRKPRHDEYEDWEDWDDDDDDWDDGDDWEDEDDDFGDEAGDML
jgi:hypothetical protein